MKRSRCSLPILLAICGLAACSGDGPANNEPRDSADDGCAPATLDANGVCRTSDGEFAPARCCAGDAEVTLRCGDDSATTPQDFDLDADGRDLWRDCWVEDLICYDGGADDAQSLIEALFEGLFSGDRTLESVDNERGNIVVVSVGEDGERTMTATPCE